MIRCSRRTVGRRTFGFEINETKTVPHVPLSHPVVERLIGTMRREFLDHVLFWNARDLERKLADFQTYYNAERSHGSLEGHTPLTFAGGHTVPRAELNNPLPAKIAETLNRLDISGGGGEVSGR